MFCSLGFGLDRRPYRPLIGLTTVDRGSADASDNRPEQQKRVSQGQYTEKENLQIGQVIIVQRRSHVQALGHRERAPAFQTSQALMLS